jgi:hypothetical protein
VKNLAKETLAIGDMKATLGSVVVETPPPPAFIEWLARLRVLEGVPFAYLVPHDELLPPESIRFFYVNRNWTDAAVDGAVSVGAVTSRDREHVAAAHAGLITRVDSAEWRVRGVEKAVEGPAGVLTGFLLRSRAVSGWPGLEVHAGRGPSSPPDRVRFLRFERLAPAVLLVLMDGVPDRVRIEEPRQGIQFGVDMSSTGPRIPLKNKRDGRELEQDDIVPPPGAGMIEDAKLKVPFRRSAPGVVHVTELARRLRLTTSSEPAPTQPLLTDDSSSDEFAVQMLQFPYRQPFENAGGGTDWFKASLPLQIVLLSHGD